MYLRLQFWVSISSISMVYHLETFKNDLTTNYTWTGLCLLMSIHELFGWPFSRSYMTSKWDKWATRWGWFAPTRLSEDIFMTRSPQLFCVIPNGQWQLTTQGYKQLLLEHKYTYTFILFIVTTTKISTYLIFSMVFRCTYSNKCKIYHIYIFIEYVWNTYLIIFDTIFFYILYYIYIYLCMRIYTPGSNL